MSSGIKAVVTGNLGKDPEARVGENGNGFTTFSVAVPTWDSKNREEKTVWVSCIAFGRTAELIAEHYKKGMFIIVHGTLTLPYQNQSGDISQNFEVRDLTFGGNKKPKDGSQNPANTPQKQAPAKPKGNVFKTG